MITEIVFISLFLPKDQLGLHLCLQQSQHEENKIMSGFCLSIYLSFIHTNACREKEHTNKHSSGGKYRAM